MCLLCLVLSGASSSAPTSAAMPTWTPLHRVVEFLDSWLAEPQHPPVAESALDQMVEDYVFQFFRRCGELGKPSPDAESIEQLRRSRPVVRFCVVRGRPILRERAHNPSALLVAGVARAQQLVWRFGACFSCDSVCSLFYLALSAVVPRTCGRSCPSPSSWISASWTSYLDAFSGIVSLF